GSGEKLRNKLLSCFRRFDLSAVSLNERYQAVIYWRAILPFLSALFIAVGFYASTFPGSLPLPVPSSFWKNVEGIGFLIYAVINLYVFSLSRNKTIKAWHQGFLRDRYIAELLRVVLHFAPFGVLLDLRKLCGDRKEICTAVRHLCAAEDSGIERLDKENSEQILLHLRELLDDQIAYHSSARKRYDRLVRHLERFARTSFIIGFVVVILRALLQFFLNTLPLPDWNLSDGISVDSLLRTVFNMLALLVPAWAAYFSSKLTLCNFRFDCDYHKRMMTLLLQEQKRMDRLQETFDDIPAEAIVAMGEHLAEIMLLKDTAEWQEQYESATVSQL
ncbi:MAG: hypothetical protein K6C08_08780, partial [Oscillospiraceae bacterium]|nr:hypothetical protein [Oscillospiraceae bacterium]